MAPAFDTAMASSGVVFLAPCGASKIGYFRPNSAISAFERWVGIGTAVGAGDAPDPCAELNANAAPAATVVSMNSRLVCSLIIAFTRARLILHLIFNQNLFASGHFWVLENEASVHHISRRIAEQNSAHVFAAFHTHVAQSLLGVERGVRIEDEPVVRGVLRVAPGFEQRIVVGRRLFF